MVGFGSVMVLLPVFAADIFWLVLKGLMRGMPASAASLWDCFSPLGARKLVGQDRN